MLQKLSSIFNTVKYLRLHQIQYQIWYRLKGPFVKLAHYQKYQNSPLHPVNCRFIQDLILSSNKYLGNLSFSFLNLDHRFNDEVDWNFMGHGKLWNYNLQYFDFLFDDAISHADKQKLLQHFSECLLKGTVKPEPYPVSLRIINWILYFSETGYKTPDFEKALKFQINYLEQNLEYHIQANHLLENYFALFISGIALNNPKLIKSSWSAMLRQLNEQVLEDGAHYECSPMYHSILLAKMIMIYDIIENDKSLPESKRFKEKIQLMLGWLTEISFTNKSWACLNDATVNIAPTVSAIDSAAEKLNIEPKKISLKESGYRKFRMGNCEVVIDTGDIIPSYQPGHAHSDMLSFCLQLNNLPVLVDTGISTYQANSQRNIERSTISHNTVAINRSNQSDVWGSFRVGARAKIRIHEEGINFLEASHDGYKRNYSKEHYRSFQLTQNTFIIKDRLEGNLKKDNEAEAFFHFDHTCKLQLDKQAGNVLVDENVNLHFEGYQKMELMEYQQAIGFNRLAKSSCIKVCFRNKLTTSIHFH